MKRRLSSISTVDFKRQLLFPPIVEVSTETTTNGSKPSDPSHQTPQSLPPSRLRASMSLSESTQFHYSHPVYSKALKISAKMGFLSEGKQLHGHLLKMGLYNTLYLQNQIMTVYVKCQELNDAHKVFDEMPERNVVVWNTLICAVICKRSDQESNFARGLSYFKAMLIEPTRPDEITLNALLRACVAASNKAELNVQLHCFVVKTGFASNCFVGTALVDSYAKLGSVGDSKRAFDNVLYKDSVSWNAMVYCYASNHLTREAFRVFGSMRSKGFAGDEFTFATLISSCRGDLVDQIHGISIKRSFGDDVAVSTALVDSYSKRNGTMSEARKVFDGTTIKNVACWNAIVVGYGKIGRGDESFKLYREMIRSERLGPDELTLASIASSCGDLARVNELAQTHAQAVKSGSHSFLSVNNSLINAYSECGFFAGAFRCFGSAPELDVFTWTSIVRACAFHGLSVEATELFDQMLSRGIKPDRVAFLAALSACSHGGLVEKGLEYFKTMLKRYRIVPEKEHYSCLVDLLGRAGLVDQAFAVLTSVRPESIGTSAFGAFLGACKVRGYSK